MEANKTIRRPLESSGGGTWQNMTNVYIYNVLLLLAKSAYQQPLRNSQSQTHHSDIPHRYMYIICISLYIHSITTPPCFFNLCNPFHFPPWRHWSRLAALDIPWTCLPHSFEALRRPGDAVSPRSPKGYLRCVRRWRLFGDIRIEFGKYFFHIVVEISQTIWGKYCISHGSKIWICEASSSFETTTQDCRVMIDL